MKTNMKILAVSLITFAGIQASAACPGAQKTAEKEALKAAKAQFKTSCEVLNSKNTMSWPAKGQEGWTVEVRCEALPTRSVSVRFHQNEDKQCSVKGVHIQNLDGSQCGLTDTYGGENDEWKFETDDKTLELGTMKSRELKALSAVAQQQIINALGDDSVTDVVTAVAMLKEGSEGGDVYLKNFTYLGEKYTDVLSYPGGNPVGTIYKYGSSKPFATNGDGSISCVD